MAFVDGTISGHCKKMEEDAVLEGGINRPDSASNSPDLNETRIINIARQSVATEESTLSDAFVAAEKRASEITQRIEALDSSCSSHLGHDLVEGAFRSALARDDHALVAACSHEMQARAQLNSFKKRNNIHESAKYPEDRLFHFSLLILFIALETGVNAFFYEGSAGLLGGAFVALTVSVVNMGIATFLGALFQFTNLVNIKHKLIGYGALVGFLVAGLVLNLFFSTFRVQYQLLQLEVAQQNLQEPTITMMVAAAQNAAIDALSVFLLHFPAIDFMSFMLFFVGFGCSVIAFWKGYTYDDKHPGYGHIDRVHKSAETKLSKLKSVAFESASASVHLMANEIEQLRGAVVAEQRNASALKSQVQGSHGSFMANMNKIQGELNLVLETYRGSNRAIRATTAPKYFDVLPAVNPADDGLNSCNSLILRIDEVSAKAKSLADTRVTTLGDRLQAIRMKIHDLVQQEFQSYLKSVNDRAEIDIRSSGQVSE